MIPWYRSNVYSLEMWIQSTMAQRLALSLSENKNNKNNGDTKNKVYFVDEADRAVADACTLFYLEWAVPWREIIQKLPGAFRPRKEIRASASLSRYRQESGRLVAVGPKLDRISTNRDPLHSHAFRQFETFFSISFYNEKFFSKIATIFNIAFNELDFHVNEKFNLWLFFVL